MKIAFDVKGTIEGYKKQSVLQAFNLLKSMGHEMFVWSNSYSYAVDAIKDNNLDAEAMDKKSCGDYGYEQQHYMDIAFEDDESQADWLAAKHFVLVEDIPDSPALVLEFLSKRLAEIVKD